MHSHKPFRATSARFEARDAKFLSVCIEDTSHRICLSVRGAPHVAFDHEPRYVQPQAETSPAQFAAALDLVQSS